MLKYIVLLLVLPSFVSADVLDQSFDGGGGGLLMVLAEGFAYAGQTVTAGLTGKLVRIDLNAGDHTSFAIPWALEIIAAPGGVPNGNILRSQLIDLPSPQTGNDWFSVNLTNPFDVTTGDVFAITLHPDGVTGSPGMFAGAWIGGTGNPYPGGALVQGTDSNHLAAAGADWDLMFRTYVEPVPEPSSILFMTVVFSAAAGLTWRRTFAKP